MHSQEKYVHDDKITETEINEYLQLQQTQLKYDRGVSRPYLHAPSQLASLLQQNKW
jgi:hypothetical protein